MIQHSAQVKLAVRWQQHNAGTQRDLHLCSGGGGSGCKMAELSLLTHKVRGNVSPTEFKKKKKNASASAECYLATGAFTPTHTWWILTTHKLQPDTTIRTGDFCNIYSIQTNEQLRSLVKWARLDFLEDSGHLFCPVTIDSRCENSLQTNNATLSAVCSVLSLL